MNGFPSFILSFDVEEHDRIEAAASVRVPPHIKADYATRMERMTRLILDRMACFNQVGTFYIVGEIARTHPQLVRDIAAAGHEIGAHGYDHRRVHRMDAKSFADDLAMTKLALEDTAGVPVFGFRAPTFSVMEQTAWAIDVLAKSGYRYDSSIYPVRHDRYGVPEAPRSPFVAVGPNGGEILELPPVTYRMMKQNFPVAGGGYFRLFPLWVTKMSIDQLIKSTSPAVAMTYLHPWEFDIDQPKLPLGRLSKFRTYVGVKGCLAKLDAMLKPYQFTKAIDVVEILDTSSLPRHVIGQKGVIAERMVVGGNRVANPSSVKVAKL